MYILLQYKAIDVPDQPTKSVALVFHKMTIFIVRLKIFLMQIFTTTDFKITKLTKIGSEGIRYFTETPWKMGKEKPLPRFNAYELFDLFTAEIIRRNQVFMR